MAKHTRKRKAKPRAARGITAAQARSHVIAPAHTKRIQIEETEPTQRVLDMTAGRLIPADTAAAVNLGELGLTVWKALKDNVSGYILHVRQNGTLVHVGVWNWAQTPADLAKGWTEDTRMHLASVSKLLTAVGMVKLLITKAMSYDTPIVGYLPTYWTKGANINKITFRHLLTHTSGFSTGGSATDFNTMKTRVAAGVPGVGSYDYENMNFGLCRILIPIINANISKSAMFSPSLLNDAFWDLTTVNAYKAYMQAKVFTPAGVANADFAPAPAIPGALAYPFPFATTKGWNSGDLRTVAGGAGWRLSIKELLNVMNHVRRKGTIISAQKAQNMLDSGLGIDQIVSTVAGKLYNKNGKWGTGDGRTEQCVAYFLPQNMELALLVSSRIGPSDSFLRTIVNDAYVNSLS